MPIFQDDLEGDQDRVLQLQLQLESEAEERRQLAKLRESETLPTSRRCQRKVSEESIRTELCEGPIPDSPKPSTPEREDSNVISDRAELIERLKRGESPTWIPNRHLESLFHSSPVPATRSPRQTNSPPSLLPPAAITSESSQIVSDEERLQEGLSIERPRSALHSGDFTQGEASGREEPEDGSGRISEPFQSFQPSRHSWIATSPPRDFAPFQFERIARSSNLLDNFRSTPSSLSSSFSSSFAYKPPTSPLVQSQSNEDIDLSIPLNNIAIASPTPSSSRRHTLYSATSSPFIFPSSKTGTPQRQPSFRREHSLPYQAHQPRRSLNSTPNINLTGSSPQTPSFLRSRRPSFSSDTSPLHHASMVGSYEESILRGRMSTTPSKPLDFLAQIGVLGLGKCKTSLRCPPHVTLSFPAVFYSYANTSLGQSRVEDGPSPYVGQIDLENGLGNSEGDLRTKRKIQSRYADRRTPEDDVDMDEPNSMAGDPGRRKPSRSRRSGSPKAPPGGSYRIPERGQIQIVIKNPNKTAVKLFLVPYDLTGMEPGTKTFIRQRSYSAGPIMDNIPPTQDSAAADRPILRYLIHLHICCPSKGRYYLYKSVRLVFANRVPDGKEKLRNETTWPEPRFTPYKPIRVMHPAVAVSGGPGAILAADKAFRRRSSGYSFSMGAQLFADEAPPMSLQAVVDMSSPFVLTNNTPVDPIPFRFPSRNRIGSGVSNSTDTTATGVRSPDLSQGGRPLSKDSDAADCQDTTAARWEKLSKGDIGYGGNAFALTGQSSPGAAEGLLSQRLRSLGVQGVYIPDDASGED